MITIKKENNLTFDDIQMPMYTNDASEDTPELDVVQLKVDGVLVPIIKLNNVTIPFNSIQYFKMDCRRVPMVNIIINDSLRLLEPPNADNMLQIQILPPFEDAYKKIQLNFHITNVSVNNYIYNISASYYIPGLYDNVMKSYGEITTYELFEQIADEYGLGLCSNIDGTPDDKRFIYNPNMQILDFLESEINNTNHLDWWIDWWNNLNIVDIYQEYNLIESDENLTVWTTSMHTEIGTSGDNEPVKSYAALTNHIFMKGNQLYIDNYIPIINTPMLTDMNYETYSIQDNNRSSILIEDGDVSNDLFVKYIYGGEVFGNYNYLEASASRKMLMQKINNKIISVDLKWPVLGLIRGGKTNLYWYEQGVWTQDLMNTAEIPSNVPLPDDEELDDAQLKVNRTISGQYYILNNSIEYSNGGWKYNLNLSRPTDQIFDYNEPIFNK